MVPKLLLLQLLALAFTLLMMPLAGVLTFKRNFEAKYTKANVPVWKQRACEKAQKYKANSQYICDDKGDVKCLPGWQGDLCQVPMCRKGCDPMNGYCQRPGECRCRIGYTGELCDKCIPLPGCQHGDCTKPFECICRPGWDGLFCTEPTCRQGCHNTRGYCEAPGECRCRIGWAGRNCSDCSVLPGCQHGTCTKPLECNCLPGYTGLLCQTPICNADCHKQHGYCKRPGECRCKVGWSGPNCDKCFPYPGCVNGDCEKPWECNCKPGWGGILCDEKLTFCKDHPNICENGGKCLSLTKEDGSYRCYCKQGYLGKNCEIIDEFLLTSTSAPRITPPSLMGWYEIDDNDENLSNDNKIQNSNKTEVQIKLSTNEIMQVNKKNLTEDNVGLDRIEITDKVNTTKIQANAEEMLNDKPINSSAIEKSENMIREFVTLSTTTDIIGTASTVMNTTKLKGNRKTTKDPNKVTKIKTSATTEGLKTAATTTATYNTTKTTIYPLNKLDEDKNLHNMPLKTSDTKKTQTEKENDDDDDDEECTDDDNDDECEYVDEDDED